MAVATQASEHRTTSPDTDEGDPNTDAPIDIHAGLIKSNMAKWRSDSWGCWVREYGVRAKLLSRCRCLRYSNLALNTLRLERCVPAAALLLNIAIGTAEAGATRLASLQPVRELGFVVSVLGIEADFNAPVRLPAILQPCSSYEDLAKTIDIINLGNVNIDIRNVCYSPIYYSAKGVLNRELIVNFPLLKNRAGLKSLFDARVKSGHDHVRVLLFYQSSANQIEYSIAAFRKARNAADKHFRLQDARVICDADLPSVIVPIR